MCSLRNREEVDSTTHQQETCILSLLGVRFDLLAAYELERFIFFEGERQRE